MMEYKGSREAAVAGLMTIAEHNKNIVIVSADSKAAARATSFADKYPDRFFEVGISEQCAVDTCAGLASAGLEPYFITYAGFITMRACEQLRTFVAYPNLNVKFIGLNAGLIGGEREGVTHQFYEDIAITRAIPNVSIVCPSDANETYDAVLQTSKIQGPCYIRVGSGKEPDIFKKGETGFKFGKVNIRKSYGNDIAVFFHGFVCEEAIKGVELMHKNGINATLVEVSTISPLDTEDINLISTRCKNCITIEDHNVHGGLGSAVAEVIADSGNGARLIRIGLKTFGETGTPEQLLKGYNLNAQSLFENAKSMI